MARLTAAPIAASSAGQRATGGRLRTLDRGPTSPWPRQRINGHRSALTWFCRRFVGAPGRGRVASCSWCAGAGPSRRWVVRDIPRVRRARGVAVMTSPAPGGASRPWTEPAAVARRTVRPRTRPVPRRHRRSRRRGRRRSIRRQRRVYGQADAAGPCSRVSCCRGAGGVQCV